MPSSPPPAPAGWAWFDGRAGVDLFVPDGSPIDVALRGTTDLGIGAHPDDLEFMMLVPISGCLDDPARSFTGVTCTDGAGSARSGAWAALTDAEMVEVRRHEQQRAAEVGGYGAMVQLGYPSAAARSRHASPCLVDDLVEVLEVTRPQNVYTHNLADKHSTHVAVGAAVVEAIRRLPADQRPHRLAGIEGWRGLDWMPDHEKVLLDATGLDGLAAALAACFPSQIEGGKRYDLAESGRRQANATLRDPRAIDEAESLIVAMDLTPIIRNDDLDPISFVRGAIVRFQTDVEQALQPYFG